MRKVCLFGVLCLVVGFALPVLAEVYKLDAVKRIESDLYRSGNIYVVTKYCYHYTYGEVAILKWEGKYGTNSIVWDDNSTCQVANVFTK